MSEQNGLIEQLSGKPILHQGQRVITLALMDQIHARPDGTARRQFNEHKDKLSEGRHYFVRKAYEAAELGIVAPNGLILLTERGYLVLVKSFHDDLAWQVQEMLVDGYFRAVQPPAAPRTTLDLCEALLKELKEQKAGLAAVAEEVAAIRQGQEEAGGLLLTFHGDAEAASPPSDRARVHILIRAFCVWKALKDDQIGEVWRQIHDRFEMAFKIRAKIRAKNKGRRLTGLDIVQDEGLMHEFLKITQAWVKEHSGGRIVVD